jgi:hypothetical protein
VNAWRRSSRHVILYEPVVQTIARHAAVILTNDNVERVEIAKQIRKLYESRSALVHAGNRSVYWSGTNEAQSLAKTLYQIVLESADLKTKHQNISAQLSNASYGNNWPA